MALLQACYVHPHDMRSYCSIRKHTTPFCRTSTCLYVRALGALRLCRLLRIARALCCRLLERVVIALVGDELGGVQVEDVGAHGVEELASVRHNLRGRRG